MAISRAKLIPVLLGGGGGAAASQYLLRDDFTTTRAAGAVDGTAAEPGPGTRDVTDTGSDLSILSSDYLQIATGTDAWNDPVLAYDEGLTRGAGAMMCVLRFYLNTGIAGCWLNAAEKPAAPGTNGYGFYLNTASDAQSTMGALGGSATVLPTGTYARCNVDHLAVIMPRSTGAYIMICTPVIGSWPTARLLWVSATGTGTPLYAGLASYTTGVHTLLSKTVRFVDASALPASWLTQWGLATDYDTFTRANGSLGNTEGESAAWVEAVGTWAISSNTAVASTFVAFEAIASVESNQADGWFETDITVVTGASGGLLFRMSDATHHWWVDYTKNTNALSLYSRDGGYTQQYTTGLTWDVGTTHRVRVYCTGNDIYLWTDDAYQTKITNSFNATATKVGFRSAFVSHNYDNLAVWPATVTLPAAVDFPVDAPAGTGSALETDAFTDTNGTALATHNADWTVEAGTWEINTNKARQTAADAVGHAVMDSGVVNHEAKVTITMPAGNPVTNDWNPAVIVRYTDTNNYIEARFIYASNNPELEIWEKVAGGGAVLIGGINKGAGNLNAGSSKTLRVAVVGQEVAAYIDDVLRLQCTTTLLTGTKCGIGTMAACEGQPTYDDWQIKAAA